RDRGGGLCGGGTIWTRFGCPGRDPYAGTDESAGTTMSALTIRGLEVAFGAGTERAEVLRGLDLDIAYGHLTAVVGASGCGKTTLLRTIAGFVQPDNGTVTVDGQLLASRTVNVPAEKRGVTLVPQEGAL